MADVPAFADFARGYLHQDLMVEYGSALDAARAFVRDATDAERRAVVTDLARLAAVTSEPDIRRASAREANDLVGFTIGGIPPFGFERPVRVIMDPDLGRYTTVWAAAGLPTAGGMLTSFGSFSAFVYPNTVSIANVNGGRPQPK